MAARGRAVRSAVDLFASFDPPKHTDHRALLARLLTPKRLQENEEFLWRLADQQIDTFIAEGRCEFVRAFGNPFTMLAIADLLGVPESDRGRFGRANQLIGNLERETFEPASIQNMERWFVDYVEARRREPRDDVLTSMAQAKFLDGSTPDARRGARRHLLVRRGSGHDR
jgi:cytochrome P450